jgi:hypothetical protein
MARIPEKTGSIGSDVQAMTPGDVFLLNMVDGAASTEDIAAAAGMSAGETTALLEQMASRGLIRWKDAGAGKVQIGRMAIQQIKLGPMRQDIVVEDAAAPLALARAALQVGDLAEARAHLNLAWMAAPEDPEVKRLTGELEAREKAAVPRPAPVAEKSALDTLDIPDAAICKSPKSRALVAQAAKKAAAQDYEGAFRDLQTAAMFEAGNARLTQFRDEVGRRRKPKTG